MPVATSYTEDTLADFLAEEVGPLGTALGWSAAGAGVGDYGAVVNAALRAYGVAAIADATDAGALELLAVREVWLRVVKHLAVRFDFSLDQQSMSRSQMQKMALNALQLATQAALPVLANPPGPLATAASDGAVVSITSIAHRNDPYTVPADILDAAGVAVVP